MGSGIAQALKGNLLLILTVIGIVLGFVIGFSVREAHPSKDAIMWIRLPGEIFLRLLQMMIVPIIVTNVIPGTASLDPRANGMISGVAFAYIMGTNITSCLLGILLSLTIRPGQRVANVTEAISPGPAKSMETQDVFADLIRNIVPDNIVTTTFRKVVTQRKPDAVTGILTRVVETTERSNILGLIFACVVFGIATGIAKDRGKPFLNFFKSASSVVIIILQWFLWYAPIGICSLIAASVAAISDLRVIFESLGYFVLTVFVGEVIIQLIMIPLLHFIVARNNPFLLLLRMHRAWFISFAATSTAVAIPDMIVSANKYGVDKRVSQFVIPFSVTLSANGSALFIVCSAIFLGQIGQIPMDAGQIVTIGILTAVAAMALPSVPSSSLVSLVIIMTSVGFPINQIGLLFTVEWFLDRIRSAANAVSHTYCAAFTYYACKKKIEAWNDDENPFEGVQEEKFNGEIINTEFKPRELVIVNKRPYTVKTTGNQFDNTFM